MSALLIACLFAANLDACVMDVFHGDGPKVVLGDTGTPREHRNPKPPFDYNKYDDHPELIGTPEWQAWYLEALGNPPIPPGMTTQEYIDYVQRGCDGNVPCGTYTGG